ncbi:MAG: hypothetical protein HY342_09195 [Candidatus Lambdaproteobacteria bacterium]|nr:hypothetical protein [Candidatus Lambdaproteobacteria bacterium]
MHKIAIGWLLTAALVVGATAAQAQSDAPKFYMFGDAKAAFGTYAEDDGVTSRSNFHSVIESNLRLRNTGYDKEPLYFELRLRARGRQVGGAYENKDTFATGALQTIRLVVGWNAAQNFAVEIGRTAGVPSAYTDLEVMETPARLGSTMGGGFKGDDVGSINLLYKAGNLNAGLMILTACQPACGGNAGTLANPGTPTGDAKYGNQTLMPHVDATFGPVDLALRIAMASGSYADGEKAAGAKASTVSSTGTGLAARVNLDAATIGIDYETKTLGCVDSASAGGDPDCVKIAGNGFGLSVEAANFYGFYNAQTTTVQDTAAGAAQGDTVDDTFTLIAVGYAYKVGNGSVHPEYLTSTSQGGASGAKAVTASSLRLGLKVKF